nr:DUF1349 domain-containing protein [Paenibacillus sp. SYP-B4298]
MSTMSTRVEWTAGKWTVAPVLVREEQGDMHVTPCKGSDFWEKTLYGFEHRDGHALLAPWSAEEGIEVSFRLAGLTELYDQAGLMLWTGERQWIKAGIELNDGVPHLAVVATDEYSDWSLSPVPEWAGLEVTVRASQLKDAVIIRARAGHGNWRTIRVVRFPEHAGRQAGPFVCAPTRAGLEVVFTRWAKTAADTDLHQDPPLPELR